VALAGGMVVVVVQVLMVLVMVAVVAEPQEERMLFLTAADLLEYLLVVKVAGVAQIMLVVVFLGSQLAVGAVALMAFHLDMVATGDQEGME